MPRRYKPQGADRHEVLLNAARYYRDEAPRANPAAARRELLALAASVNDWAQAAPTPAAGRDGPEGPLPRPRKPWEVELLAAAQHFAANRQNPKAVLARLDHAARQPE